MDVMIDLETLGTTPDAAILSIGAVLFDPRGEPVGEDCPRLYCVLDYAGQDRRIDDATVTWWKQQSAEARREVFEPVEAVDIKRALSLLGNFFGQSGCVWSQGASFDVVLLEDAYRQHNMRIPWKFWNVRDTRTCYDMAGDTEIRSGEAVDHIAWLDALKQAQRVQRCYAAISDALLVRQGV